MFYVVFVRLYAHVPLASIPLGKPEQSIPNENVWVSIYNCFPSIGFLVPSSQTPYIPGISPWTQLWDCQIPPL